MFRNIRRKNFREAGSQNALVGCIPEIACIDGQQQVGRRSLTFRLQFLDQRLLAIRKVLDRYTGFRGVSIEYRLDELFRPGRVNDHRLYLGR